MATQAYLFLYVSPGRVETVARAVGQLVLRRIHRVRGVEVTDTRIVVEA